MFIWGSGGGHAVIGDAGAAQCSNCNSVRAFKYGVNYRYAHIWYLFKWITKRTYVRLCSVCDRGADVPKAEALAGGRKDAIPLSYRFGGYLLLAAIAVGIVAGVLGYSQARARVEAHVAHPEVGDVFLLDLAKVTDAFEDRHAYGLMKVVAVTPQGVTVITGDASYDRMKGARKDFRNRDYDQPSYFDEEERIDLPTAKLSALSASIDDVAR